MNKLYLLLVCAFMLTGCSDFLDIKASGVLDEESTTGKDQLDKLVISAYSMLGNDHYDKPFNLWPYGDVRSDDAYKGGRDEADIQVFHFFETSTNITPNFGEPDALWYNCYIAISRANNALNGLNKVSEVDFPNKKMRIAECRFLRGHFYFLLKIMFKNIPYIDETVDVQDYGKISNRALSNEELWQKIADDFKAAYDGLPESQGNALGRANKFSAAAYLAKTLLYRAYRQDEKHNVTGIDAEDLNGVLFYTSEVMKSRYKLEDDFANNFLPGTFENGKESLFAVQHSTDDGTLHGRLNFGDALNVPMKFSGACDFHKPSQNLVNAYRTDNGLPMFSDYNKSDYNPSNDKVDPRLYHTVALPGVPYKYDEETIFDESWTRNSAYGLYSSLKENVALNDPSSILIDPFRANTKNRIVIRYAEVLLMHAEALIELDREKEALSVINQVRERAQKSVGLIPYANNLGIELYKDNMNCTWTKPYAREALRWERRLELAMEGQRFFDLVRWGIADSVINNYYKQEASKREYYGGANFEKNKAEYVPVPQQQISFSKQVYKQNYGYN